MDIGTGIATGETGTEIVIGEGLALVLEVEVVRTVMAVMVGAVWVVAIPAVMVNQKIGLILE